LKVLPLAPFRSVLKLERRVSHEGMVSVGGNLYRVPDATRKRTVEVHTFANEVQIFDDGDGDPAIQSLPPHFSIDCSTMPSSSRSKARATTCANIAHLMPEHLRSKALINTPIPTPPLRRRGRPPKNGPLDDHLAG
jgi:hypothetical protein